MKLEEYVGSLRSDSGALANAARGRLDVPIPSCPEWTMRDLVVHVGVVHRFWSAVVESRARSPKGLERERDPGAREPVEWFLEGADQLAEVLQSAEPDANVWSWSRQRSVAFVQRRMAQETAVHRWDAQAARGNPAPIDPELAVDGIDEMFDVFYPVADGEPPGRGETVHLHRTDGDGEWLVRLGPERVVVERGHLKGDAAVRGSASDLLLMLWRRIPPSDLDVFGDPEAVARLVGWIDLT